MREKDLRLAGPANPDDLGIRVNSRVAATWRPPSGTPRARRRSLAGFLDDRLTRANQRPTCREGFLLLDDLFVARKIQLRPWSISYHLGSTHFRFSPHARVELAKPVSSATMSKGPVAVHFHTAHCLPAMLSMLRDAMCVVEAATNTPALLLCVEDLGAQRVRRGK